MKIFLVNNLIESEAIKKIKRCGYAEIIDSKTRQRSFVRRLGNFYYPRFHIYLERGNDNKLFYNLHLDQKKPSYAGSSAHNAEYDSEVVQQEAERIKKMIN